MLRITILLLTICLSSCRAPNLKPQPFADIAFFLNPNGSIDFNKSRCRIRCVDIDAPLKRVDDNQCGEDFVSGNFDIRECDGLTGVHFEILGEDVIPWARELKRFGEDECRR